MADKYRIETRSDRISLGATLRAFTLSLGNPITSAAGCGLRATPAWPLMLKNCDALPA
jgi:hypothetical protein